MKSKFYTNYTDIRFIDKLKESIDLCQAFYFSVSFIKKPGLKLLAPNIKVAIARGAKLRSSIRSLQYILFGRPTSLAFRSGDSLYL